MKIYTIFRMAFLTVVVIVLNGCTQGPTSIATPEMPTPTLAPPTPTTVPQGRTLLVTSADDSGPGTLRQALQDAQMGDTITFDPAVFPPDAPETITVTSGLPEISRGYLTIDASNAGVILDGRNITAPSPQHGLSIPSDHNFIRGLQIVGFSNAGIGLYNGAQYNMIGGDRSAGDGPLGQGNLISGNGNFGIGLWGEGTSQNTIEGNYIGINLDGTSTSGHPRDGIHSNGANENLITDNVIGGNDSGVYLCCVKEGRNTVTANIIGTDPSGKIPLGNRLAGITVDRTSYNTIGPGNIIAYNDGQGILFWEETPYNTITQNSIHDNGEQGIDFRIDLAERLAPPIIFEFDLQAGTAAGVTCPSCVVEVFSDDGHDGETYEGSVTADQGGSLNLKTGISFTGPGLMATATAIDGSTSMFSNPTSGAKQSAVLQEENTFPRNLFLSKSSHELQNTRIGDTHSGVTVVNLPDPAQLSQHSAWLGHTWIRLTFGEGEWSAVQSTGHYSPLSFGDFED